MANDRSDPWPALVLIGMICGIAVGTIIMMLRRRDDGERLQLTSGNDDLLLSSPDVIGGARLDPLIPVAPPNPMVSPLARTATISTSNPTFLLRATGPRDWTLHLRVLGPPGSSATFLFSGSQADQFVVPAGAHDTIRLPGYQSLYALGNMPGVAVSVSGGEVGRA